MQGYGQFCPVAKASQLFCQRWTPLIIRDLALGPLRFSDLQRGVPTMSPTLLSRRLKELQAEGVLLKRRAEKHHLYELTESGQELVPMVVQLGVWGQRWTRRALQRDELNLGLFVWAFERSVNPNAFRRARTVVELELTDQPKAKQKWWFLHQRDSVELCLEQPSHAIDLYVSSTLPTMIQAWRGDTRLSECLEAGTIEVHGSTAILRAFPRWFGVSSLAHVPSQRS